MISTLIAEERYRELREEAARRKKESRRPAAVTPEAASDG
jgi:oxygen-independent coproporphyrinogen-3 oxidase